MSGERYPADLKVSANDFYQSAWREALAEKSREGYPSMWSALSEAARRALSEDRPEHGKVLWLLADACSMMLAPVSPNAPFRPFMVIEGRRSVIPDDFSEADIAFFEEVVDQVDNIWLRARLTDLIWLKQSKRDVRFALAAIDAYRSISLDRDTWVRGGRDCWVRGIVLARMLRGGAGDRLVEIEAAILQALESAEKNDGFLTLWLADLLADNGLGYDQRLEIAQKLEAMGGEFDSDGDIHRAREHFNGAAKWYKQADEEAKAASMTVAEAESWVKEAIARVSSDSPSYIASATFYEHAIQVYRTIPRSERAVHKVDERLAELLARLREAGDQSVNEMQEFTSPGVDVSEIVENAREAVRGRTVTEALKAFCNLHRGVDVQKARGTAERRLDDHPLQALFPATIMSRDGRVIAQRPGMSLSGTSAKNEENEVAIRAEMIRDYGLLVGIVVQADILPALEVMWLEHRLSEAEFVGLASQSPIIPKDRVRLFGKALFFGFDGDFVAALHLLTPQVENLVRHHLKVSGVKTTKLDTNGIEHELGLSSLVDYPEIEQIFGPNLAFELRALFCDPFGSNLRNELAHGLLDESDCRSIYSVYAWWFCLRLTFNTFWNSKHKSDPGEQEDDLEAEDD
jgi:hypothetical protein